MVERKYSQWRHIIWRETRLSSGANLLILVHTPNNHSATTRTSDYTQGIISNPSNFHWLSRARKVNVQFRQISACFTDAFIGRFMLRRNTMIENEILNTDMQDIGRQGRIRYSNTDNSIRQRSAISESVLSQYLNRTIELNGWWGSWGHWWPTQEQ